MKTLRLTTLASAATITLLMGCTATKPVVPDTQQRASNIIDGAVHDTLAHEQRRLAQQIVDRPFLAGKVRALPREQLLPTSLQQNVKVTAIFGDRSIGLQEAVRQLTLATRVPIAITPDALMPASAFAPRTATASSADTAGAPSSPGASFGHINLSGIARDIPLFTLLDEVARQAHVSWEPQGQGVRIYRTETAVLKLHALPTLASTSSSSGRNSANTGFAADSKTSFELPQQNPIEGIQKTINAMLTTGGVATVSAQDQTIVVTDIPEVVARVAKHVEDINRAQGRAVRLVVEAIEVVAKDNQELGVDWNLFYNRVGNRVGFGMSGPASLVGTQAGQTTLTSLRGGTIDSTLVLKALSEVGTVVSKRTFPILTRSGRPATQTLRTSFNYVDSVQVQSNTANIGNNTPAPSVTQKEETVGTVLTLIPKAMDNGQIYLNLSLDVSTNEPLRAFTVGSSDNGVTVQQKTINSHSALQEIPMRSGETVLIGGIDMVHGADNRRRLGDGAPLISGGSNIASQQRSHIAILVTAVAQD